MAAAHGTEVPIRADLFDWPSDDPRLIASRCGGCGSVAFPKMATCINPECTDSAVADIELSTRGRLDTFTVMRYQPPPPWRGPESLLPLGQGFIELPEGIAVAAVLTGVDPEKLEIGMQMELVIEKLYTDDDGSDVMTYKFRPVTEPDAGEK